MPWSNLFINLSSKVSNTQLLKVTLFDACTAFVNKKEGEILSTIKSHQAALTSETKSSAGDKHETGRAMLQLEMEKASQQLNAVYEMRQILSKVDHKLTEKKARIGSLVFTEIGSYYLAISAGEIKIDGTSYFAVSTDSPIGKLLLGTASGDQIHFRRTIEIIDVV